ncbi:hypothetical protein SDC9_135562 [bioreactor metagenome]|uniref:Uncharacterized protein n=1 Tax=bioreactor metagenome TaxID=1076179 RepID=A0A645DHF4_9ZZZZ
MGKGAPKQDAPGELLHRGQDAGARGGKAGNAFKQAVHKGREKPGEMEGQGTQSAHQQPDERHGEKALPGKKTVVLAGEGGQHHRKHGHKGNGENKRTGVLPVYHGNQKGQQQGHRLHHQSTTRQTQYKPIIHDENTSPEG